MKKTMKKTNKIRISSAASIAVDVYEFKCPRCGKWVNSSHQEKGSELSPLVCPGCGKEYETLWSLDGSIWMYNPKHQKLKVRKRIFRIK